MGTQDQPSRRTVVITYAFVALILLVTCLVVFVVGRPEVYLSVTETIDELTK